MKPSPDDYVPDHVGKVEREFPRGAFVMLGGLTRNDTHPLYIVERVIDFEGAAWLIVLDQPQGKPTLVRPEDVRLVHKRARVPVTLLPKDGG